MAYSKAKFKSKGDKASPCFRPFWMGNVLDKYLLGWTVLQVSFNHALMGTPNAMRILYNTTFLTGITGFLEVNEYCCTVSPVTVAERSKACTVFARSEPGIVGSNSTQGMDV
jgi:hypothetical protein